jgi:hypothetical protein
MPAKPARSWATALCFAALVSLSSVGAVDAETAPSLGVQRLTKASYEDAVACGHSGERCAITPYLICPAPNGPFTAYIATPYSRVASAINDALKAGKPARSPGASEANYWGFGVYVFPANSRRLADSIEKVMIRRGSEVIEPLTATTAPAVYRGAHPPLTKGFFAFPMDAFTPSASITFILMGTSGTIECSFDRSKLEALK